MVGSIDPRCETLRGTHWPVKVAVMFGTRVAENHLGQRSTTASTGRTYGCKRSDQTFKKTLAARGPSTYGSRDKGCRGRAFHHHHGADLRIAEPTRVWNPLRSGRRTKFLAGTGGASTCGSVRCYGAKGTLPRCRFDGI